MLFDKKLSSSKKYHEIIELIKEKIVNGELSPGDKLPSEQEMVDYIRESTGPLSKKSLMEEFPKGARVLNALKKKGIVVEYTDPSLSYEPSDDPPRELTRHQDEALSGIVELMEKGEP